MLAALTLAAPVLAGCTGGAPPEPVLRVAAAASLGHVLKALGPRFEADEHVRLEVSLAGSSLLARQVVAGAPVDVLLTADRQSMQIASEAGAVAAPIRFATNRAVIVVAREHKQSIRTPGDLKQPGLVVVICAPQAACGAVGEQVLSRAGVASTTAGREPDVNAVLARVRLGEADAGVAYATDGIAAHGALGVVEVEPAITTPYLAAVVKRRTQARVAARFVAFLRSAEADGLLAQAGFARP